VPRLIFNAKTLKLRGKIKFAPKPNKPRRLDTLSNVLSDVRVGSIATEMGRPRDVRSSPNNRRAATNAACPKSAKFRHRALCPE
jgi:hypothetical protein